MSLCQIQVSHNNLYFMSDLHSTHYVNTLIANKSVNDHFTSSSCAEIPTSRNCRVFISHRKQENSLFSLQLYDYYFLFRHGTFFRIFYTFLLLLEFLMKTLTLIPVYIFFVIYFQGEKKDRIGHFYSTGLQVKQLVLIFTILLNSEHPCCHMYRVNVHEAQSLYCLECSQGYVLTIPGIPW